MSEYPYEFNLYDMSGNKPKTCWLNFYKRYKFEERTDDIVLGNALAEQNAKLTYATSLGYKLMFKSEDDMLAFILRWS
jgi:hypothetical protein